MNNNNKKILMGCSIVMIILICIAFTTKPFQNDTFYTIKVGESILDNGIDMKDHFSWHDLSYTYPHWLYDVIIYKVYDMFDFNGLYVFNILCFIVVALTFYFVNLRLNKSYFLSLLFSIFATIMIAHYITARAQLFTYFLFILEVYFIERLLSSSNKRYMIYLMIICLLVANLHAAVWPFYFVLMLPYLFSSLVSKIGKKFNIHVTNKVFMNRLIVNDSENIKLLGITFLISLFIGLLTPIGSTPYTYFIKIMQGNTMEYIEEHKALVLTDNAFVWAYMLIVLVPLVFTKVKVRLSDICMILGLLVMSFISTRHVAFLAIIGVFCLCRIVSDIGKINTKNVLDFDIPAFGSFIVLITVVITSMVVFNINSKKEFIDQNIYPVTMVNYIYDNLDVDKIKLYNDYDFGSYLLFRDLEVYIDSRSDLYTKPFNGEFDIFDECMNIETNYGRVFNKYGITHILIYRDTSLNQILTASPNYELVHKEGRFSLFEYLGNEEDSDE